MQGKQAIVLGLVVVLLGAVIGAKVLKSRNAAPNPSDTRGGGEVVIADAPADRAAPGGTKSDEAGEGLPRLLDLGSMGCQACKQMEPILAQLEEELDGEVSVEFIDIAKQPSAADEYGIKLIPTQIFLDASGKELHRHEGVYPKEDILAKMREVGMIK